MKLTKRAQIRRYIKEMLTAEVDVGGRVYTGRQNSPLFKSELPAIHIHFGDESAEVNVGSEYFVKTYLKKMQVNITAVVANQVSGDSDLSVLDAEDYLDDLVHQVERAFHDDWMLARRLEGFDENSDYFGLTHGNKLLGSITYDVESDSDVTCIGSVLKYELPFEDDGYPDRRYPYLEIGDIIVIPQEALE